MAPHLQLPTSSHKKFILTIGDEGAILIYQDGNKVLRRMFAPTPNDTKQFLSLLKSDEKAPIHLLVDVMDQTYVPQTLPPVSPLSINKLIQRRLDRDFPPDDLRGAVLIGRASEGRKDWNYLFAAVSHVPPLSLWLQLIEELPNRMAGIHLLPLEAEQLLSRLFPDTPLLKKALLPLNKPAGKPDATPKHSQWQIVVSHQKVGGFRQIVFHHGKLIFTRLAQPIGEPTPEVIAGNVEQELANTVEYLKRLSFNPAHGLDVVIIVASEIRQSLNIQDSNIRKLHLRTPHEVAQSFGLLKATEETDHFGDVVLTAAFGLMPKQRLTLFTPYTRKLSVLYQARRYGQLTAMALATCLLLASLTTTYEVYNLKKDLRFQKKQQQQAEQRLQAAVKESQTLPDNLSRISDVVAIYESLSQFAVSPFALMAKLSQELDETTLIQELIWHTDLPFASSVKLPPRTQSGMAPAVPASDNASDKHLTVQAIVDFLDNRGSLKEFNERAENFFNRLRQRLPRYTITHDDLPGTISSDEIWKQDFNNSQTGSLLPDEDISVPMNLVRSLNEPKDSPTSGAPTP